MWLIPLHSGKCVLLARRVLHRLDPLPGGRVVEVQPPVVLGDHEGIPAVRGEVEVVHVLDADDLPWLAGARVDRQHRAARNTAGRDIERRQVVRGHDVLRLRAAVEPVNHTEGGRVDDVDVVAVRVRHVDEREVAPHALAEHAWPGRGVHVLAGRIPGHAVEQVVGLHR
jgi:hypothetical protein